MAESDIDENVQLVDLGLDSISGVTWVRKINEKYHTSIEATKVYSYPTLSQLSRYVKEEAEKHGTLSAPRRAWYCAACRWPPATAAPSQKLAAGKLTSWRGRSASRFSGAAEGTCSTIPGPIAVIGMAGQFPQARNLEEYLAEHCARQELHQPGSGRPLGCECLLSAWTTRWRARPTASGSGPWKNTIGSTLCFSTYRRRKLRAWIRSSACSCRRAGTASKTPDTMRECCPGASAASSWAVPPGTIHQLSPQQQLSAQGFTGSAMSILAARISYFLNLQGPCLSIDTACSSSLVAIAHACDSLISGGSDLALAGGVYVMAGPEMHIKTAQAGMLSSEGKCFTFDQRADGFVPGEGVGVVMLKRLADAQRDRDIIYGVIQGWGVNQDGKTNGITAPNPESQTRLEQEVYDKYRIDPANIQLIEAHGTGTKLGDPIEVEALKEAFKKYTRNNRYCALGVGEEQYRSLPDGGGNCRVHQARAGAASTSNCRPPSTSSRLNEHIDLKDSPFYVNTRLQEWELKRSGEAPGGDQLVRLQWHQCAHGDRRVSAAGRGQTAGFRSLRKTRRAIVPLSARTAEQLRAKGS